MTREKGYILEKVFHDVKDLNQGVLYTCITIMAPESSKGIIKHFLISPSASFYDDLQVLSKTDSFQPALKRVDPVNVRSLSIAGLEKKFSGWNPNLSVGLIIIVALIAISLYSFLGYNDVDGRELLKGIREKLRGLLPVNNTDNNQNTSSSKERCGANLWLVIPCKHIESALKGDLIKKSISLQKAVMLANDSVYFLAKSVENDNPPQIKPDDSWKEFPEGSDLLIQLYTSDGGDLIGEKLKRSLARKIDAKEEITIENIGLLSNLNNLQEFNRA